MIIIGVSFVLHLIVRFTFFISVGRQLFILIAKWAVTVLIVIRLSLVIMSLLMLFLMLFMLLLTIIVFQCCLPVDFIVIHHQYYFLDRLLAVIIIPLDLTDLISFLYCSLGYCLLIIRFQ